MTLIIVLLAILAIGVFLTLYEPDEKTVRLLEDSGMITNGSYKRKDIPFQTFNFSSIPDDYRYFQMVGMYYRNLDKNDFGIFDCWAKAEEDNPYDPYAVAIYRISDGKHLGYIPAGDKELHRQIIYRGGLAKAIARIQGNFSYLNGTVYIKNEYKVFRKGGENMAYKTSATKEVPFSSILLTGRHKCRLIIGDVADEFNYTVTVLNENGEFIGVTGDNEIRLFDYVNDKKEVAAACVITGEDGAGLIFVPLNYTEKTSSRKIEEFINKTT